MTQMSLVVPISFNATLLNGSLRRLQNCIYRPCSTHSTSFQQDKSLLQITWVSNEIIFTQM